MFAWELFVYKYKIELFYVHFGIFYAIFDNYSHWKTLIKIDGIEVIDVQNVVLWSEYVVNKNFYRI